MSQPKLAVYFDDNIFTGVDDADHIKNLKTVVEKLSIRGIEIKVNSDKWWFFAYQVNFLGYAIIKKALKLTRKN